MNCADTTLVTGGCGYFGTVLVERLLAAGRRVRVLDKQDSSDRPAATEFLLGDIRDPSEVRRACKGVDTVFHCVAQVPISYDANVMWSVNRDGTRRLLEGAAEAGVRKTVYLSSSAIFGAPRSCPIMADTPPTPAEEYGAAKAAGEDVCREFAAQGLDVTVIRPRTIMGPQRLGIWQMLFEAVYTGKSAFVFGRGDNLYQFVHADDLAEACILAADRPGFSVYNIGAAKFGTMRETMAGLIQHAGTNSRVRSLPTGPAVAAMKVTTWLRLSPLAPFHWLVYGKDGYFDLSKPQQELGYAPRYSNVDAFAQAYDWYVTHRAEVLADRERSLHRSPVKEGILKLLRWI